MFPSRLTKYIVLMVATIGFTSVGLAMDSLKSQLEIGSPAQGSDFTASGEVAIEIEGRSCNRTQFKRGHSRVSWRIKDSSGQAIQGGFAPVGSVDSKTCLSFEQTIHMRDDLKYGWYLIEVSLSEAPRRGAALTDWRVLRIESGS